MKQAIKSGKSDTYSAMVGGFVVAEMPNGKFDYFPTGQNPHVVDDGKIVKCGTIVARYSYNPNGRTWKEIG